MPLFSCSGKKGYVEHSETTGEELFEGENSQPPIGWMMLKKVVQKTAPDCKSLAFDSYFLKNMYYVTLWVRVPFTRHTFSFPFWEQDNTKIHSCFQEARIFLLWYVCHIQAFESSMPWPIFTVPSTASLTDPGSYNVTTRIGGPYQIICKCVSLRCFCSVEESILGSKMYVLNEYFLLLRLQVSVGVWLSAVTSTNIQLIFFSVRLI